jgi:exonuclease III
MSEQEEPNPRETIVSVNMSVYEWNVVSQQLMNMVIHWERRTDYPQHGADIRERVHAIETAIREAGVTPDWTSDFFALAPDKAAEYLAWNQAEDQFRRDIEWRIDAAKQEADHIVRMAEALRDELSVKIDRPPGREAFTPMEPTS